MAAKRARANGATLLTDGPAIDRAIEKYQIKHPGHGFEQICQATKSLDSKKCGPVTPVSPRTLLSARNGGPILSTGLNAIACVLNVPLETLVAKVSQHTDQVQSLIGRAFQRATKAFLDEYVISERGIVPFGGRDTELKRLDDWLLDREAAPRFVVTSPPGRGKSALLVRWMQSLRDRGYVAQHRWHLVFVPISIRTGTNKPATYLRGLIDSLAQVTGQAIAPETTLDTDILKFIIHEQFETIALQGIHVLVVLDGLDEALEGTFDASIIPAQLRGNVRIVLSARWQVGDVDSAGWLRRLGWDRNFRVEHLELGQLTPDEIADVIFKLGAPIDLIARERAMVARLAQLTEGEPILVRYYAEDLWQLGHQGAHIEQSDLDSLSPGFGHYFERWLKHQERLWSDEGIDVEEEDVDRVLSILAFALGPLESRDLLELMSQFHHVDNLLSERQLLRPLRRFIIGDGKSNSGYILSHPKIADYLKNERFGASAPALRRGFATWCQKHLRSLNSGALPSSAASRYALQYSQDHVENLSSKEWMEFTENGWRKAWEHFEGTPKGFASDVRKAWHVIRRDPRTALLIGENWRCALLLSSIKSIRRQLPGSLLFEAVFRERLSIEQVRYYFAEAGWSDEEIFDFFMELAEHENLSKARSKQFVSVAFETALLLRKEDSRAWRLTRVASSLSPKQLSRALDDVKAMLDVENRAPALAEMALSVPQVGRAAIVAEALAATNRMQDAPARANTLAALIPYLPVEQRSEAIAGALTLAKETGDKAEQANALLKLAEHVAGRQKAKLLSDAFAAAKGLGDLFNPIAFSLRLSSSFTPQQRRAMFQESLVAAKAIADQKSDAAALVFLTQLIDIVPQLSASEKAAVVRDAFTATKAIVEEDKRADAIAQLAKRLTGKQLMEGMVLARAMSDARNRFRAMTELIPRLSPGEAILAREEEFAAAIAIVDDGERANALGQLAADLSSKQLDVALSETDRLKGRPEYFDLLAGIAERLAPDQKVQSTAEALVTAKTIGDDAVRARALRLLAPHLSPAQLSDALIQIGAITDPKIRTETLDAFSPHLSWDQIPEAVTAAGYIGDKLSQVQALEGLAKCCALDKRAAVLNDALAIAESISSERDRALAFAKLAGHLSPTQLSRALADMCWKGDEIDRREFFTAIGPFLSESQKAQLLVEVKASDNEADRVVVLTSLAPHLSSSRLALEALDSTKSIHDARARFDVLLALVPRLSSIERGRAVAQALDLAKSIVGDLGRLAAFAALAKYLSPKQWADVLAVVKTFYGGNCAYALRSLMPDLASGQRDVALAIAKGIDDERERGYALRSLAEYLTANQLRKALSMAKKIHDKYSRSLLLAELIPYLPSNEATRQRDAAFSIALSIRKEDDCAIVLRTLAPHLSPAQLTKALSKARSFHDEESCFDALVTLVPHIPAELRNEAVAEVFAAAKLIRDKIIDTPPFSKFLACLTPKQICEAFGIVSKIQHMRLRAQMLEALAPRLSSEQIPEALAAAQLIDDPRGRAEVLASMAPLLSAEQLAKAFAEAARFEDVLGVIETQVRRLSRDQQAIFLKSLAQAAGQLPRPGALELMTLSVALSLAVGGVEALEIIDRSIGDAAHWYP